MPRQMRDPAFRADQEARLHEPHIGPITDFIQGLRDSSGEWVPWVAPLHGGVEARVLSVLRDPGPKVHHIGGSGMLCIENDDQTAETMYALMEQAGMVPRQVTPWNAYPLFINAPPTPAQMRAATPTLLDLADLMPELGAVLLQGGHAKKAWGYAQAASGALRSRNIKVFETYHPSQMALRTSYPDERKARIEHRISTWRAVGEWLRSP